MRRTWDVIVAGAGAVGSAATYQLARRGARVLAIDRFTPPHDRGSSHGDTRITRLALGEGDQYVQFAQRSHQIWRELEAVTGSKLLREVGCLVYGSSGGRKEAHGAVDFLGTTIDVAQRNGIPHEVLDAEQLRRRFPQFHFREDERGCLEHSGGLVHPEACVAAQLRVPLENMNAELRTGEQVIGWKHCGEGVRVETDKGSYEATRLILSAGAWMPGLVEELGRKARVFRQVMFWFETGGSPAQFLQDVMPVYIRVPDASTAMFYGFPAIGGLAGGMKVAGEQFERTDAPEDISAEVGEDEQRAMFALVSPHVRIGRRCLRSVVCKYTVTSDFGFVIDQHPESDRVWLASACSGHGFKHSAAVGEALADACLGRPSQYDLSPFQLKRFVR